MDIIVLLFPVRPGRNRHLHDEETAGRLEGIGNATLDHVISIDNNLTRHLEGMATSLGKIAGNSEYLRHLETINENIAELRRGVKLKT